MTYLLRTRRFVAASPRERATLAMLNGWLDYADAYRRDFEVGIGADAGLGAAWADAGRALNRLLHEAPTDGGLDFGELSMLVEEILRREGYAES